MRPMNAQIVMITLWPEWGPCFSSSRKPKRCENRSRVYPWMVGRTLLLHGGVSVGGGRGKQQAIAAVRSMARMQGLTTEEVEQITSPDAIEWCRGRVFGMGRVAAVIQPDQLCRLPWSVAGSGQYVLEDYCELDLEPGLVVGTQGLAVPSPAVIALVSRRVQHHPAWSGGLAQREV